MPYGYNSGFGGGTGGAIGTGFGGGIGGNFGGAFGNSYGNFTPNANPAYQWGGPTGVGLPDVAGQYTNQAAAFKMPVYTNSMDQDNWAKIAAGVRASQPSLNASSGWQFPGGSAGAALMGMQAYYGGGGGGGSAGGGGASGGYGGPGLSPSYFDQFSPMGSNAGAMGGGYQGPGVGNWPQSVSNPSAALASGIYGAESTYGQNPRMWTPNQYGAVGPMQMTPIGQKQYAPNQNIYTQAGNMAAGGQMSNALLNQFGNPASAAAAYNWGPTAVASGRAWPSSVQGYSNQVLNNMGNWGQGMAFQGQTGQALAQAGVPGMTLNSGRY
jgi:hypothetical protein